MKESILTSTKKFLMIAEDYEAFDPDIIMHINTVLRRLNQINVGVPNFYITDKTQTWDQFLPNEDEARFVQAKSYVYLRVRLLFDPPQNSTAVKSIEENIREYEWLLYVDADPPFPYEEE